MLISIASSLPTFKSLTFKEGLNILLSERNPGSSDRQTRNSAGKTSFVEIIHFLLGADCKKESIFKTSALIEHSFFLTLLIAGKEFTVERSGAKPARLYINEPSRYPELPIKFDKKAGRHYVSNVDWRSFLGQVMFGLKPSEDLEGAQSPTFRSLMPYFARRKNSGGFISPERQAEMQQRWDWQVSLSFLLKLDWQIPFEFQRIRDKERTLEELRKAANAGTLIEFVGTVAELRPLLTIAERKAEKLRQQLKDFEVLDSYKDISREVARVKSNMQALSRELITLQETSLHLKSALTIESPPDEVDLQKMYLSAGVELPDVALRRFEEVSQFYKSIVENRKTHLQREISETDKRIFEIEELLADLDAQRSVALKTLEGKGAFEDLIELQGDLAKLDAEAAALRERYHSAELLQGEATQLDLDRVNLKRRLQEDHQQRKNALDEAILLISETITELYDDRTGRFVVDATDNGPEFKISIEGDRGGGISSMEIFCLDLTLLRICANRNRGPRFLVHDSHLFDGVDVRQIAKALLMGYKVTKGQGLQYIVTMNSDIFNQLPLPESFDISSALMSTQLSDETETGGLFGIRFD